jgi:hypothetical protein
MTWARKRCANGTRSPQLELIVDQADELKRARSIGYLQLRQCPLQLLRRGVGDPGVGEVEV